MHEFQDICFKGHTPGSGRKCVLCGAGSSLASLSGSSESLFDPGEHGKGSSAPTFWAQLLPRLWSSPIGILNFQFGSHLNLKPDQLVKSHLQARQPLRKPHKATLLRDVFLGMSLRCHLKLQETMSKWKGMTELYANFMTYPQSHVYKWRSLTFDRFLLGSEHTKASELDTAKHVHFPCSFCSRNEKKAKTKKH